MPDGPPRICLVTPGQPSTNPRLVKEAGALAGVGYDVQVVACKYQEWADEVDGAFKDRDWTVTWLHYGPMASRPRDFWQRLRRRGSKELAGLIGPRPGLTERAFHYAIMEIVEHRTTGFVRGTIGVRRSTPVFQENKESGLSVML